jgi:hypothetical protein
MIHNPYLYEGEPGEHGYGYSAGDIASELAGLGEAYDHERSLAAEDLGPNEAAGVEDNPGSMGVLLSRGEPESHL